MLPNREAATPPKQSQHAGERTSKSEVPKRNSRPSAESPQVTSGQNTPVRKDSKTSGEKHRPSQLEPIISASSSLIVHPGRKKTSDLTPPKHPRVGIESSVPRFPFEYIESPRKLGLSAKDIFVIAVLWTHEVVHVFAEAWAASYLLDRNEGGITEKIKLLVPKRVGEIVLIILTVMAMIAIPAVVDGKSKFSFLLLGLTVYLATPIIAILASNLHLVGLVDTMLVLDVGWHSIKPLRYWLIFHQKFPLPVIETRIIVSINQFVVELAEYATTVWVTWEAFSSQVYSIVWTLLLVVMLTWIAMILKIRVFFNNVEDNITLIRKEYSRRQVLASFLVRQKARHVVVFLCLIFPIFMISFQKAAVSFVFRSIKDDLPKIALYRIDLILSLMCLPLTANLLITLPLIRHEIRDLVVVGVAHLINILVCIFFLALISGKTPVFFRSISSYSRQIVIPSDVMFAYIIAPDPEYKDLILVRDGEELSLGTPYCREILAINGKTVLVEGKLPNGTTVFEKNLTLTYNTGYYLKKRKITEIKHFYKHLTSKPREGRKNMWLLSGLEPCNPPRTRDENGTRCMFKKGCHSVNISLTFANGHRSAHPVTWNVPLLGEEPHDNPIAIPFGTDRLAIEYIVDGQKQATTFAVYRDYNKDFSTFFFIAIRIAGEGDDEYFSYQEGPMTRFSYEAQRWETPKHWTSRQCKSFALAMCLSSVAISVALASYIHFIWIQCPASHRVLILALFFSADYFASWLPSLLFNGMGRSEFLALLAFQVLGGVWHAFSTVVYCFEVRKLTNQKQGHFALF